MNYENVKFGNDCRSRLIEGVNLAADAVAVTYGPNGHNAIISTTEGVKITKDGFHTAMMVNDKDPYVSMGIQVIKDICKKTAKDVGDATSTSAIMAREIINKFADCSEPIKLSRMLTSLNTGIIKQLSKYKKIAKTKKELIQVATISANNDSVIGELVGEAFDKVGKYGVVNFQEAEDMKDRIDYSNGFRIDRGYFSPKFINTTRNTCELENVMIYISETKMEEVNRVYDIAEQAMKEKKSLLLIAPDFDSEITIFLSSNKEMLKSCMIISPSNRNYREILLNDMRMLFGSDMTCKKVNITKDTTTFIGCDTSSENIQNEISKIKEILSNPLSEFETTFYQNRLANFTSGIATIYVGGFSEIEMKERFDRIEDAVCATQAALKEGILPGGGVMLRDIADLLSKENEYAIKFAEILRTPSKLLHTENETKQSMIDKGVLEPFLVTKVMLENAITTALLVLTADVAIVNMFNYFNVE